MADYLIDTHVLLWWAADSPDLSEEAREAIAEPENTIFVSSASIWEIAIKTSIGKLEVDGDLEAVIVESDFTPLTIDFDHAQAVQHLPWHHRDPFDRMRVAQAIRDELCLVTHDEKLDAYNVPMLRV